MGLEYRTCHSQRAQHPDIVGLVDAKRNVTDDLKVHIRIARSTNWSFFLLIKRARAQFRITHIP